MTGNALFLTGKKQEALNHLKVDPFDRAMGDLFFESTVFLALQLNLFTVISPHMESLS